MNRSPLEKHFKIQLTQQIILSRGSVCGFIPKMENGNGKQPLPRSVAYCFGVYCEYLLLLDQQKNPTVLITLHSIPPFHGCGHCSRK